MKTFYSAILLLFMAMSLAHAQDTLVLQPGAEQGKDAFVHGLDYLIATNYGDNPQLPIVAWTFLGVPGNTRALIDFELPATEHNYTLLQAKLTLYAWDSTTGMGLHSARSGSNDCWVQRITTPWDEHEVAWFNQPLTTLQNQIVLPGVDSIDEIVTVVDITQLVMDNLQHPDSGFGIMLTLQEEVFYRRMNFASSDHPNANLHPKLELIYTNDSVHPIGPTETNGIIRFSYGPNPAKNQLVIEVLSETANPAIVQVINSQGKAVVSEAAFQGQQTIDISGCQRGLYFVRIQQGSSAITRKLFIR
jgi:hypothetical protein